MIKLIVLTALALTLTASETISQPTDTASTTIPNVDLRRVTARLERLKADSAVNSLIRPQIADLRALSEAQTATIDNLRQGIRVEQALSQNYQSQVATLNRSLKVARRQKTWLQIGGGLVIGALTYLYITK